MLRLTPLREIESVQEMLKEERIEMLLLLIQDKFGLTPETITSVAANLAQLDMNTLKSLVPQLLHIETFSALEEWLAAHQSLETA
ncbi:MAG: hypothetical protein R3C14_00415 [Caldilineaceae bacterium]